MKRIIKQTVFFEEGKKFPDGGILVVPNMVSYIRDVLDVGPIGAVVNRFLELPPTDMLRLGINNLPNLPKIAGKDFASGLMVLAEIELLRTKNWKYDTVVLVDQVSDLSIAYGNYQVFGRFIKIAHQHGKKAGVWTNNFCPTVLQLGRWRLKPDLFISPFNDNGYLANPNKNTCEELLKVTEQEIWTPTGKDLITKIH